LNWLVSDFYLKEYDKNIGFTENTEVWPNKKHADILLNKIELIAPGLTQKLDDAKKKYVPLPIKNAVYRRFRYETNKRKEKFGIIPEGKFCILTSSFYRLKMEIRTQDLSYRLKTRVDRIPENLTLFPP
jgi:hypothetical protein